MKKRTPGPLAKISFQRYFPRKTIAIYAAILTLFLFFTQAGIAATGTVSYNTVYQEIEGFGGAIVYDVTTLASHSSRETIYDLLFRDLGLDVLRIRNSVGYDDSSVTATKSVVAEAKESQRNPALKLELVPWSPPGSIKSNGSPSGGGTLAKSGGLYVYAAYADWWANSLETWASGSTGLTPEYISIQNEPDLETSYDSCKFLPTESTSFAGYDQAFAAVYDEIYSRVGSTIPSMPKMLAPETMGITGGSVGGAGPYLDALATLGQMDNIYGFSSHIYSDGTGSYYIPDDKISDMEYFRDNYGDVYDKPLLMTEYIADGTPTFQHAVLLSQHIYNCLVYENVTSYYHWSLIRGTSSTGGVINLTTSGYAVRDTYYWLKHYMYFTDPGFWRVGATTDNSSLEITAFKNPAGDQLTIVIPNTSTSNISLDLTIDGFSWGDSEVYRSSSTQQWASLGTYTPSMSLPGESITTIVLYYTGLQQTLTCSSSTGGSVTTPGEGSFQYTVDTNATIVATADSYYHFVNWTGTAVEADKVENPDAASTKVYMDANYTVIANFEANPPDINSPTPDPMTWATVPTATGPTTITMTATTATDSESPPVQYYFECTNDASKSSAWQASTTYAVAGLSPSTQYSFRVQARDSYLTPNETDWSSTLSATTQAPPTDINIIGTWLTGTTHARENGYSRALIFIAHGELAASDMNLSSVTYGGQTMTKVIDRNYNAASGRAYAAAFILKEAGVAAATTSTFSPTWSGTQPTASGYSSAFFSNVDQTSPVGASASGGSTTDPVTTSALATSNGDMVIDAATCGNNGSYTLLNSFIEGTDQTMGNTATGVTGYKRATGAAETPSADFSSTINRHTIIGFVLQSAEAIINDPPAEPTNLTATPGNEIVTLNWNDNSETDLLGYNVYRSTTSGSGYSKLNGSVVSESNYVDNVVDNGTPYFYVVTAVDDANNMSGYSNEASATPDYQNCSDIQNASLGLESDLNGDCYVDYMDLETVAYYWLNTACNSYNNCDGADFAPADNTVDFADFNKFAEQWMQCNDPADLNCQPNW